MRTFALRAAALAVPMLVFLRLATATTVPGISFEELTDKSEVVASGTITRSWAAWDADGRMIWTHYELKVTALQKGRETSSVEFAEPGGILGNQGTMIAGTVEYQVGDTVLVFLERMPNGYLRTTGWSQGKFRVDREGRIHAGAASSELQIAGKPATGSTSPRILDGMTVGDARSLVGARLQAQGKAR